MVCAAVMTPDRPQPPGLCLWARKGCSFPFPAYTPPAPLFLLFFSPIPAPGLLHCLSWGKGAAGGFLLNIWIGCPSALGSFGSERKPAEGDRTCPWPFLFLAFPGSLRKM